jgi:hypothetical protein
MNLNTYNVEFFAKCPGNGVRVKYTLEIQTEELVMVEDILEFVDENTAQPVYHEQIADAFAGMFPGIQVMRADHHGVHIETVRGFRND